MTRYKDEITIGDTAFLMGTGPKRAIRALMRIDHAPRIMPELESEQVCWKKRDTEARCRVEGTLIARVNVAIDKLKAHEDLKRLSIFHGWQQQTNFRVSDEEGRVILGLVSS